MAAQESELARSSPEGIDKTMRAAKEHIDRKAEAGFHEEFLAAKRRRKHKNPRDHRVDRFAVHYVRIEQFREDSILRVLRVFAVPLVAAHRAMHFASSCGYPVFFAA